MLNWVKNGKANALADIGKGAALIDIKCLLSTC